MLCVYSSHKIQNLLHPVPPFCHFLWQFDFLIHNKCNKIIHIKKDRTPYIMIVCGAIIPAAAFAAVIAVKRRRGKKKAE